MKTISIYIILFCFLTGLACASGGERVDWVVYLVVMPQSYNRAAYSNDGIEQYEFPLYVGYIYSNDSKFIKWNAFEGSVEREMKNWAEGYSKYDLVSRHPLDDSGKMVWRLADYDFLEAALVLLPEESGFYPVRYERNAIIDKNWRPIFPNRFRYSKEDVEKARIPPMPKKVFTPLNWDQDAYNERMKE